MVAVEGMERERRREVVARLGWIIGAAVLLLVVTVQPFADANVWWHLALGRLITSHGIPAQEPFSYLPAAHPWVGQQWLLDVPLAGIVGAGGAGLASAVLGVVAACGFLLAALAIPRVSHETGPWLAFAMVLSGVVASRLIGVNAEAVSLFAVAAVLYVLARWREGRAGAVWILPPLFLVWANVDTLFAVGLLIVASTLLVASVSRSDGAASRGHLAAALAASVLLTLVNPYGPGLYASVITTAADPAIAQLTASWASPDFHTWWLRLFEAEGVLLVVLWATSGGPAPIDAVLGIAALVAALWSEAYVALFAIIALPQIALYGTRAWRLQVAPRVSSRFRVSPARARLLLVGGLIAVGAAAVVAGARQVTPAAAASYEASHYPMAAADYVAAHYPDQRLYSTDTWGGYLAYRFPTGRVVLVYDQGSTFGDAAAQSYTKIHLLQNGWEKVLRDDGIAHAIVLDTSQEASALHELGWVVACHDSVSRSVVMSAPPPGTTPAAAGPLTAPPAGSPAC